MAEYRLMYSETSRNQIRKLHPEIKTVIRSRLDSIQKKLLVGKKLERELSGYRSLRAKRFRIIYKLDEDTRTIEFYYVGHRRDIYELFSEKAGLP